MARRHAAWVALDAIAAIEVESPAYSPREREQVCIAVEDLKDRLRLTIRRFSKLSVVSCQLSEKRYERAGQKMRSRR